MDSSKNEHGVPSAFFKRMSEVVDSNEDGLCPSQLSKKESLSKLTVLDQIKSEHIKMSRSTSRIAFSGSEQDSHMNNERNLNDQQLTFRKSPMTTADLENQGKEFGNRRQVLRELERSNNNSSGFGNREKLQMDPFDKLRSSSGLNSLKAENKETCSRKLDFSYERENSDIINRSSSRMSRITPKGSHLSSTNFGDKEDDLDYYLNNKGEGTRFWEQGAEGEKLDLGATFGVISPQNISTKKPVEFKLRRRSNTTISQQQESREDTLDKKNSLQFSKDFSIRSKESTDKESSTAVNRLDGSRREEGNEEAQLKKMVEELQKKLVQRDAEILSLQNENKTHQNENKSIISRITQSRSTQKQLEDELEQMSHQISCQQREAAFLKVFSDKDLSLRV